jgi:ArsR family transcriptional regulator
MKQGEGLGGVSTPLYQLKAEFFKTLGHPARIRELELLSEREHAVSEMLPEVEIEPAHLSQQLAVLQRAAAVRRVRLEIPRTCTDGSDHPFD